MAHDSDTNELVATLIADLSEAQVMLRECEQRQAAATPDKVQDESPAAKALRHTAHRFHTARAEHKDEAKKALYEAAIAFAFGIS